MFNYLSDFDAFPVTLFYFNSLWFCVGDSFQVPKWGRGSKYLKWQKERERLGEKEEGERKKLKIERGEWRKREDRGEVKKRG